MNKKLLVLALALISVGAFSYQAKAEDNTKGISLEVGADLVTSYLWRGYNLGGLSIQPSITLDWNGLYLCGWANIGADSWLFQEFNPELDITIGYDNHGFMLDLTHLHYFYGDTYFQGLGDPNNAFSSSTMELHAGVSISEWAENVPLTIDWYTTVLGNDPVFTDEGELVINANGNAKRAYSTYIQLGYDIFDIRSRRSRCIQLVQRPLGLLGDDIGNGGLAGAAGAVEDHVGYIAGLDQAAQDRPLTQDMVLTVYFIQCCGPQKICQRLIHPTPLPSCFSIL